MMVIENDDKLCDDMLSPLKYIYNVNNIYVGHTPNLNNGIDSICDKKIWLTDYGASKSFDPFRTNPIKKLQVLEILNDGEQFNILYEKNSKDFPKYNMHISYEKEKIGISS